MKCVQFVLTMETWSLYIVIIFFIGIVYQNGWKIVMKKIPNGVFHVHYVKKNFNAFIER